MGFQPLIAVSHFFVKEWEILLSNGRYCLRMGDTAFEWETLLSRQKNIRTASASSVRENCPDIFGFFSDFL